MLLNAIPATGQAAPAQTAPAPAPQGGIDVSLLQAAWLRLRQAITPEQQAYEARNVVRVLAMANVRPGVLELDVRDIASGRAVPLDDPAVLQRPQAHEVTMVLDGRFYVFRPLSRAALEPLIGR